MVEQSAGPGTHSPVEHLVGEFTGHKPATMPHASLVSLQDPSSQVTPLHKTVTRHNLLLPTQDLSAHK